MLVVLSVFDTGGRPLEGKKYWVMIPGWRTVNGGNSTVGQTGKHLRPTLFRVALNV